MPWLGIALAFSIMSTLGTMYMQFQAARGQKKLGQYQQALSEAEAKQMETRAGQERASAQRRAIEERRVAGLVGSRATALAGASGAGVSDATVTNLLGDIDTEGELRALTALYEGEEMARGLEYGAQLTRAGGAGQAYAGALQGRLTNLSVANTIMSGGARAGSILYEKYGQPGQTSFDRTDYG